MPNIKIELPKIEGTELKNVTANLKKGYVIAEYGEKKHEFKKGDIVYDPFWGGAFIIIKSHLEKQDYTLHAVQFESKRVHFDGKMYITKNARLTTPSEQQILFNALAKEGKYWDAEALKIKVPESISIYKLSDRATTAYDNGDGLYIGFNDNKQLLCYSNGVYSVNPFDNFAYEKVQCYLQPCKKEDLKVGDTWLGANSLDCFHLLIFYQKALSNDKFAFISSNGGSVLVAACPHYVFYYKLIPVE